MARTGRDLKADKAEKSNARSPLDKMVEFALPRFRRMSEAEQQSFLRDLHALGASRPPGRTAQE